MKCYILTAFVFSGLLRSCNSSNIKTDELHEADKPEIPEKSTSTIMKNLKAIDTDIALITAALMAPP